MSNAVRSFFGRIYSKPICLQFYLTFSKHTGAHHPPKSQHLCKGVLLYLCISSSLPFWTKLAFLHFFVCCYLPLTVNSLFTGVAQSGKKPKIVGRHNFDLKNFYFSLCSSVLLKVLKSQNEILQFSQRRTLFFSSLKVCKSQNEILQSLYCVT